MQSIYLAFFAEMDDLVGNEDSEMSLTEQQQQHACTLGCIFSHLTKSMFTPKKNKCVADQSTNFES